MNIEMPHELSNVLALLPLVLPICLESYLLLLFLDTYFVPTADQDAKGIAHPNLRAFY